MVDSSARPRLTAAVGAPTSPPLRRAGLRGLGFVTVYFALFAYPVLRVGFLIAPQWSPSTMQLLLILVAPAIGWLIHQHWRNGLTRTLLRGTLTWLGIAFLGFVIVVFWEVGRGLFGPQTFSAGLLVSLLSGLTAYALLNAHRVVVRRQRFDAPGLDVRVRIVQLSDVHIGSRTAAFLRRVVARTNRLRPDYVLITGDLFDLIALPDAVYEPLRAFNAPVYFSIGNHERYIGADAVCEKLSAVGVVVLRDAAVTVDALQFIGIDDAEDRQQVAQVLPSLAVDATRFTVLLYHRPDGLEAAVEAGVDLMLCGHTHNAEPRTSANNYRDSGAGCWASRTSRSSVPG